MQKSLIHLKVVTLHLGGGHLDTHLVSDLPEKALLDPAGPKPRAMSLDVPSRALGAPKRR